MLQQLEVEGGHAWDHNIKLSCESRDNPERLPFSCVTLPQVDTQIYDTRHLLRILRFRCPKIRDWTEIGGRQQNDI